MADVSFNRLVAEINPLLDKIDETEIFTSEEKQKLSALVNYDDSDIMVAIANLEARITALEANGGESENET